MVDIANNGNGTMKRPSYRNSGFTLIEILVVIGIILVLIGIVFVALKHVSRSATENATKIDLQNLQSMLAELENAGPLTTTLIPQHTALPDAPTTGTPPTSGGVSLTDILLAPGEVTEEHYLGSGNSQ